MSEMLELTQSLLYDLALEMHIDLDAAFEDQENVEDRDFEKAKEHICSILGEKYLWKAKDWLDSWECFDSDALVQIPGTSPASRTPRLQEAQEILCRYLFLIQAKIMRSPAGQGRSRDRLFDNSCHDKLHVGLTRRFTTILVRIIIKILCLESAPPVFS
ncbi:MAG: hypothetical protein ACOCY5_02000 [Desulfohalobiaceae bacterium]